MIREPQQGTNPQWSRDGRRILQTIIKFSGSTVTSRGFIVVDVTGKKKAQIVTVPDPAIAHTTFTWDAEEKGVVALTGTGTPRGVRFFSRTGKALRDMADSAVAGTVRADDVGVLFTPSRRSFLTGCADAERKYCVWDVKTGQELLRFTSDCEYVYAWYDETHVICHATGDGDNAIVIADLTGNTVRTLLRASAKTMKENLEISFSFRYS